MHVIENDDTLIAVDERNGAITRIFSKRLNLDLIAEPRLAGSFKLLLGTVRAPGTGFLRPVGTGEPV